MTGRVYGRVYGLDDACSCRWVEPDDFDGPEDHADAVEACMVHGYRAATTGRVYPPSSTAGLASFAGTGRDRLEVLLATADASRGMAWWNALSDGERRRWADRVANGVAAAAWAAHLAEEAAAIEPIEGRRG